MRLEDNSATGVQTCPTASACISFAQSWPIQSSEIIRVNAGRPRAFDDVFERLRTEVRELLDSDVLFTI
jgi:hypothetical protein